MGKTTKNDVLTKVSNVIEIEKYDEMSKLSLLDWYNLLAYRKVAVEPDYDDSSKEILASCLVTPLGKWPFSKPLMDWHHPHAVNDIQILDVLGYAEVVDTHYKKIKNDFESISGQEEPTPESMEIYENATKSLYRTMLEDNLYQSSLKEAAALIDLRFSDEQIFSSFKKWLSTKRDEAQKAGIAAHFKKKFTQQDALDWSEKKILPYIDLMLLCKKFEVKLPYHIIGNVLFPDEYDVDLGERVRKVIKPLAEELFNHKTLEAILASIDPSDYPEQKSVQTIPE